VIAVDTSSLVAYLAGDRAADTEAVDDAIGHNAAVLPPVVLTELLSASNVDRHLRSALLAIPMLDLLDGHWERAGILRARLHAHRLKARLADTLIAQSCLDHDLALITRDRDFGYFEKHAGLRLALHP
jgi:predicted nucleic acid-binding protein